MDPATITAIMSVLGPVIQGFAGNKGKIGSTYTGNQQSLIDDLVNQIKGGNTNIQQQPTFQAGQDWLQGLFSDPEFFRNFEAPLKRQFEEEIAPGVANRFASMGSGGALGSTGFRNQIAREGSNLSTNIAALRGGLQSQGVNQGLQYAQQPIQNIFQMLQSALQPTQNTYQQSSFGF